MVLTVLIVGATGKQGGSCITELLRSSIPGLALRGLTRSTSSPNSQILAKKGVAMVQGNLEQASTLSSALSGVDIAFLMTDNTSKGGAATEIVQGKTFIDCAQKAGVNHIVFTSVDGAERDSKVPHFDSKFVVEEYLRASGLKWTILRPVAFMDNLPVQGGFLRFMALGLFTTALKGKSLQWIACEDIGRAAARVMEAPKAYQGDVVGLAGDDLTMDQVLDVYEKVQGSRPWRAWLPELFLTILPVDFKKMFEFFRISGYEVDIPQLRKVDPQLLNLEQWVRKNNKQTK